MRLPYQVLFDSILVEQHSRRSGCIMQGIENIGLRKIFECYKQIKISLARKEFKRIVFCYEDRKSLRIAEFILGCCLILENYSFHDVLTRFYPLHAVYSDEELPVSKLIIMRWQALQLVCFSGTHGRQDASNAEMFVIEHTEYIRYVHLHCYCG